MDKLSNRWKENKEHSTYVIFIEPQKSWKCYRVRDSRSFMFILFLPCFSILVSFEQWIRYGNGEILFRTNTKTFINKNWNEKKKLIENKEESNGFLNCRG